MQSEIFGVLTQDNLYALFKITNHEIKISQSNIQCLIIIFNPNVNKSSERSQLDKNTVSVFITENIMFIPLIKVTKCLSV